MNIRHFGFMTAALAALAMGCGSGDDDKDKDSAALEIVGEYTDQFDGSQVITAEEWNGSAIKGYDNDANVVYTQWPADDEFSANLFTKTVYTEPEDGDFAFCMVVYDAPTLDDAKSSDTTADESDLAEGCNGFEWSVASKN